MASIQKQFSLIAKGTSSAAVHASPVQKTTNEVVLTVDGEGVSINNIAPNRVVSAFSTSLDTRFLCAPVSFRQNAETSVTWAVYEENEDVKLLCWTQSGVDCTAQTIPISVKKSLVQFLAVDETGHAVALVSNGRLECYEAGRQEVLWTWQIPADSASLQTFTGNECPLTDKVEGRVLLLATDEIHLYSLSAAHAPALISSIPLVDPSKQSSIALDVKSGTMFHLSKRSLSVHSQSITTTHHLSEKFDNIHTLSKSHVLLTSSKGVLIYDTVYGTTQAELAKPITFSTVINTNDPLSFHAVIASENELLVCPITIPASATLLDAIGKDIPVELPSKARRILLPPKSDLQDKANAAVQTLLASLKTAADAGDIEVFDKQFKEFRREYKANRGSDHRKTAKLAPLFVKDLLDLIFERGTEGLKMRFYPKDTIDFLLQVDIFSRDLLPGGAEGFVSATLGNKKFLKSLLKKQPTPFTYRDYLVLIKYILDTPAGKSIVPSVAILDAFERDAETFFDRPDMKTVLSTDHLQHLLTLLTQDPEIITYPTILSAILDAMGLGPLLLTQSLPTNLLDTLHTTIENESITLSTCLETSSILSLVLHRQKGLSGSRQENKILHDKRKLGETGWLDIIAEEGGMARQKRAWMKKPNHPGSGKSLTHRFIATNKFQDAGVYSLDRMIM